jgi:hypothetical protein
VRQVEPSKSHSSDILRLIRPRTDATQETAKESARLAFLQKTCIVTVLPAACQTAPGGAPIADVCYSLPQDLGSSCACIV